MPPACRRDAQGSALPDGALPLSLPRARERTHARVDLPRGPRVHARVLCGRRLRQPPCRLLRLTRRPSAEGLPGGEVEVFRVVDRTSRIRPARRGTSAGGLRTGRTPRAAGSQADRVRRAWNLSGAWQALVRGRPAAGRPVCGRGGGGRPAGCGSRRARRRRGPRRRPARGWARSGQAWASRVPRAVVTGQREAVSRTGAGASPTAGALLRRPGITRAATAARATTAEPVTRAGRRPSTKLWADS